MDALCAPPLDVHRSLFAHCNRNAWVLNAPQPTGCLTSALHAPLLPVMAVAAAACDSHPGVRIARARAGGGREGGERGEEEGGSSWNREGQRGE